MYALKLLVDNFKQRTARQCLKECSYKIMIKNSDKEYIFEVDAKYSKNLHNLLNDLPFLPKRIKIKVW